MEATATRNTGGVFTNEISQYLTFLLGNEHYGIEILKVQEIKGYSAPTPIPGAPRGIKGVMNLRGTVVPVVDLRSRFDMPEQETNQFTVVIVVTVGAKVFGLIVDAVSDVLDISTNDIEATPDLGADVDTTYMTGLAKAGDRLVMLLNIDRIIDPEHAAVAVAAAD
jgi:purine-binding chemotaxis protein CheW